MEKPFSACDIYDLDFQNQEINLNMVFGTDINISPIFYTVPCIRFPNSYFKTILCFKLHCYFPLFNEKMFSISLQLGEYRSNYKQKGKENCFG